MADTKADTKSLTYGEIYDAVIGLTELDKDDIKLTPDTLLSVAIDINLLKPVASAYERARMKAMANLNAENRKLPEKDRRTASELEHDFAEADAKLRAQPHKVAGVRAIMKADLRMSDNARIRGSMLARLMPLLVGLE